MSGAEAGSAEPSPEPAGVDAATSVGAPAGADAASDDGSDGDMFGYDLFESAMPRAVQQFEFGDLRVSVKCVDDEPGAVQVRSPFTAFSLPFLNLSLPFLDLFTTFP